MSPKSNEKIVLDPERITKDELRASTKHRKNFAILTSALYFVATVFLILVNIGNVGKSKGLTKMYMFKLDVTNIVPASVPDAALVNSLARTLGLHDFYQVGMWNYCEGYNSEGVTTCSKPELLYWFNPVEIILNQLLAGATIALPSEITTYLKIIRIASQVMFGCFFASTMSSFIMIFLAPFTVTSKLFSVPIAIFGILSSIATIIGAGISTGMWNIFAHYVGVYGEDINISADVGLTMQVIQWIAGGCAFFAMLFLMGLMCCGTSRRDIKSGRRVSRKMWRQRVVETDEDMPKRRHWFGAKKRAVKP